MVSRYKRPAPYLPAPIPGNTARRNMSDVIGAGTPGGGGRDREVIRHPRSHPGGSRSAPL